MARRDTTDSVGTCKNGLQQCADLPADSWHWLYRAECNSWATQIRVHSEFYKNKVLSPTHRIREVIFTTLILFLQIRNKNSPLNEEVIA